MDVFQTSGRESHRRGGPRSIWHLLADPDAHYQDLGSDYYQTKVNTRRRERDLIRQLETLTGKKASFAPAAAA